MKKELLIHFGATLVLLVVVTLFRKYFDLYYWTFWLGGVVGTFLPDLDHFIYIYLLQPQELTSQRVTSLVQQGQIRRTFELMAITRSERKNLIFHTILFQLVFFVLAFLVISSSGSMFGTGLVLAFILHLSVDQIVDFMQNDTISNWFKYLNWQLTRERTIFYLVGTLVVILIFALFF